LLIKLASSKACAKKRCLNNILDPFSEQLTEEKEFHLFPAAYTMEEFNKVTTDFVP
jgi:hypothetical protein